MPARLRDEASDWEQRARGRPPGIQNILTREIKKAAIDALIQYGVDGTGKGGLQGYFYRCADLYAAGMLSLAARIMPTQPPPAPPEQMLHSVEEFDEALKARGLPSLRKMFPLQYTRQIDNLALRDGKFIDLSVEDAKEKVEKKP